MDFSRVSADRLTWSYVFCSVSCHAQPWVSYSSHLNPSVSKLKGWRPVAYLHSCSQWEIMALSWMVPSVSWWHVFVIPSYGLFKRQAAGPMLWSPPNDWSNSIQIESLRHELEVQKQAADINQKSFQERPGAQDPFYTVLLFIVIHGSFPRNIPLWNQEYTVYIVYISFVVSYMKSNLDPACWLGHSSGTWHATSQLWPAEQGVLWPWMRRSGWRQNWGEPPRASGLGA